MTYSISQAAAMMGTTPSTIRYYDKNGLLPFVKRDQNGRRAFVDNDFNFLKVINCLKKSGVPVKNIGGFINLCMQGDQTLAERYDYLDQEETVIEAKVAELQEQLDFLRFKKWYYKTSLQAGTEAVHFMEGTNVVQPDIHEQYLKLKQQTPPDQFRQLIDL
ncbi:UNVERIFIED_CONTAM: MerR family transcriptional regulator [Limosilactobacillus fermentum]|uniref:MerR family transcriptional regulator n=2 Tax=Limosilactobacillus fermentum TaxID=1613 RepID=A0AAJ5ZU62_LIMFE|nr:MerR family transcriptional regulator [Limosilactobacillus fermentum]MED7634894.1 MerR family transcriptional regulator [Limosilactobacillus fermentum]WFR88902.1 MerR family transcriptional regulator [Limosilactobacillus fermentum]